METLYTEIGTERSNITTLQGKVTNIEKVVTSASFDEQTGEAITTIAALKTAVDANTTTLSGVDTAIATAKSEAIASAVSTAEGYTDNKVGAITSGTTVKQYVDNSIGDISPATSMKAYTDDKVSTDISAAFDDYVPYTVEIVDALPQEGADYTYYLVPKSSGNGYDKWWYINDGEGNMVWDNWGGTATLVVSSLPENPDPDADYILVNGDAYLYYKWYNNAWHMVGGSAVEIVDSEHDLPQEGNSFTDYYKEIDTNKYQHYRYIDNAWCQIGTDSYSKTEIDARLSSITNSITSLSGSITAMDAKVGASVGDISKTNDGRLDIAYNDSNLPHKYIDLNVQQEVTVKNLTQDPEDNTRLTVTYTNNDESVIVLPAGGGGGGGSGNASITRITPSPYQRLSGAQCLIEYTLTATDSGGDAVGDGSTATWYFGGVRRATSTANNGNNSFDATEFLSVGTNNIKVSISVDTGGETPIVITKTWTVNVINLYLTWDYDESTINEGDTVIRWTPYGEDINKTTHIYIDDTEYATSSTTRSGVLQSFTIPVQAHGAHVVKLYLTATINEQSETSDSVSHEMIFVNSASTTPIISCSFFEETISQYDTVQIPVVIYTPSSLTSNAVLAVDGTTVDTWTNVDRTVHYWNYTPITTGEQQLTITSGVAVKTITVEVEPISINNEEVSGYDFKLKANELASNEALRNWELSSALTNLPLDQQGRKITKLQFSQNFDWINGGLKTEIADNGSLQQYICVKAGTTMTIPYLLFGEDCVTYGRNFKIMFKIKNCRDYDAQVAQCYADNIGIRLNAHEGIFSSSATSLSVPYGEDEFIELEYDVYPSNSAAPYMMAWIDGVITTARVYTPSTDIFVQTPANAQSIVIGSPDCDVYVYLVKTYAFLINRDNHIDNFIADALNAQEMVKRYNRNDILDAGEISYEKLAQKNPDCRVWLYDIPYLSNAKDDKVQINSFQQIWNGGTEADQVSGTGKISIQGTSSVDYILGAANTDINFSALQDGNGNNLLANGVKDDTYGNNYYEGEPDPETGNLTLKIYEVENPGEEELGPECIPIERDAQRRVTKYIRALGFKLNPNSTPISYSNTKVNFASCEQVNNMCNAAWYQRYQPYQSLTPRDTMEFEMGVQFIKDSGTVPDAAHFVLFGDNKYHMYSIANMGNSKKNVHVCHDLSNPNECCVEIDNNIHPLCRMLSDDFSVIKDWETGGTAKTFVMRYPDVKKPSDEMKQGWYRFARWMATCNLQPYNATDNPLGYTGEELAEPETYDVYTFRGHNRGGTQVLRGTTITDYAGTYTHDTFERRMAKMLSECEDYLVMDSIIYHFVYLERHTMVDNVAKNSFWSSSDLVHWDLSKAYDMDTSDGNNNEGQMVFDYGNEADDVIGTKNVFNASDAVWFVFASHLPEACRTMFVDRESAGAWSAVGYHNFLLSQQQKVPERIWNECYWRDYLRTYEQGINTAWLSFLDGGQKTHQRKHYETFEELYDASKYRGSASTSQQIGIRGYTPSVWTGVEPRSELTVKMYNKIYAVLSVGGRYFTQKLAKGQYYTFDFSSVGALNDSEIYLYSAPMLQEISGLAQLYPGYVSFSNAIRLRSLAVGSTVAGYQNSNLEYLTLGNNGMLEYLYAENLPNAATTLDLTNCPSLLYVDATGSGFTGYAFATGGLINTANLNAPTGLTMRDLSYLNNDGLDITDYSRLSVLRVENCPDIDILTLINSATNLTTLRLVGIDWTLPTTDLLNQLLTKMGLNEDGSIATKSVLVGEVTLTGAYRQSELQNYANAWPDLVVHYDPNYEVPQYPVTFVNADSEHTVLYSTYVDVNTTPVDPVYEELIDMPTVAPSEQYTYSFGTRDGEDNYVQYSGWKDQNNVPMTSETQIVGATVFTAVYTQTVRTYNVSWWTRPNGVKLAETNVTYGSEVVYPNDIPTDFTAEAAQRYRVFTGWDKSTGFIHGDTMVYAVWDEDIAPTRESMKSVELKDLSNAQLYALSRMSNETLQDWLENETDASLNHIKDEVNLTLGHDFSFTPAAGADYENGHVREQILVSDDSPMFFDGTLANIHTFTDVKPFAQDQSFVLAIDYKFTGFTDNSTLVSCYDQSNDAENGFRLFFSAGSTNKPRVNWGQTAAANGVNVGNYDSSVGQQYREMVVIRHKAGSNNLFVYHGDNTQNENMFGPEVTVTEIYKATSTQTDMALTFGARGYLDNSTYNNRANGVIYWSKIWWDDLGDTNCKLLASWPHEKKTFNFAGVNLYDVNVSTGEKTKLSFIANDLLAERGYWMNSVNSNSGGFNASLMKTFLNNRIYQAFPTVWKAMMKDTIIKSSVGDHSTVVDSSRCKVYLPSVKEVFAGFDYEPYSNETTYTTSWFTAGQTENVLPTGTSLTANDTRIKFQGYKIADTAKYIVYNQNPYSLETMNVQPGDVWIYSSNYGPSSMARTGYIYVSQTDVDRYKLPIMTDSIFNCAQGGWIPSAQWTTRSPYQAYEWSYQGVRLNGQNENFCYSNQSQGVDICYSI